MIYNLHLHPIRFGTAKRLNLHLYKQIWYATQKIMLAHLYDFIFIFIIRVKPSQAIDFYFYFFKRKCFFLTYLFIYGKSIKVLLFLITIVFLFYF